MYYGAKHIKKAFTLAEILITLAIVGIIAAIIIANTAATIIANARAKNVIGAKHKFAKAIEKMALNYDMGAYYGTGEDKKDATAEFVNKLSEYYKINKICSTLNLEDCFGYTTVKFPNGANYNITNITNGRIFKNGGNESLSLDFDTNTRGILALDGTRFILAFNKNCDTVLPKVYTWSSDGTSNSAMGCVAAIMDIDGNKAPNTIGKDVSFINATGLGNNCIVEIGEACFGTLFAPSPMSYDKCKNIQSELGITKCIDEDEDYYAGAVYACGGINNLISYEEMENFYKEAYKIDNNDTTLSVAEPGLTNMDAFEKWEKIDYRDYKRNSAPNYGLIEPDNGARNVYVWTNSEYKKDAVSAVYNKSAAGFKKINRNNPNPLALCKMVQ